MIRFILSNARVIVEKDKYITTTKLSVKEIARFEMLLLGYERTFARI